MTFNKDFHIPENVVKGLAKNYNPLDYRLALASLLKTVFPNEKFEKLTKYELHKLLNEILLNRYHGEEILKYKLSERYLSKPNIVGAFEIKVNNSRVDFLTINGFTTSFEIKSELDNLSKLRKQMTDYLLAFEYNYLIVDERHIEKAIDFLPESFGLWSYNNGQYEVLRKSRLNTAIDPEMQLKLLTKKELTSVFVDSKGSAKKILKSYEPNAINSQFKKALKQRYRNRWQFLTENNSDILPIDLQFFFNTNVNPKHIYNH